MSEEVLLDLGFLTEEERDIIKEVILKDVRMRKLEQSRISRLRKELGELKEDGLPEEELEEKNDRYCARCQTYFGSIWNKGALCPRCGQKVCKTCRENVVEEGWLCTLCCKVREVKAQSGAWFFQAQKHKDDKLFGSLLLRQSLRRLPSSENRQLATEQKVGNHKPVSNTDKIHADVQNQNNINYDGRTPNDQAEKARHASYNKARGDEQYSDISDEDLSDEGSHDYETFSPREDSEKSLSKEHESSSHVYSDDETVPRDESSRKEADEYEARLGDESPSWKRDEHETRPGDESSRKEADAYEARLGDESPSWKRDELETSPGDESSRKEADEYETKPGDESPSWKRDEYETRPGEESSIKEADEYETKPGDESSIKEADEYETKPGDESSRRKEDEYDVRAGDESSNWKAEEYEESPGDESSNWKADEYETRPGDESSNWQAQEHEVRPDYEDTRAGDPQGVGYQAAHVHEDVSNEAAKPQQDHDISATATINSEVPSTADEPSPLDSRESDLVAFSQTFASSVQENQGPRTPDLPGPRVTDHGDDRRPSDRRHGSHGSFNADDESNISETSGYVTPTPSEDTSSKRTPSISGDEGARTPRDEYRRQSEEGPPVIITTVAGGGGGSLKSDRSSFTEYDEDLDVSFSKYEGGLGNRMLKDQMSMGSRESIMSYYSNAGGEVYGKYPVTGDIYFGVKYDAVSQEFQIQIHQARDITAVDEKNKASDPYVKTYLLPDRSRSGKRKSKVRRNTINPVFDEIITYKVSYDELLQRTLWLAVWNHDRFGHNDFLGEVLLPLDQYQQSGFSLEEPEPQWYHLCERQADDEPMAYNGEIVVALKYVPPSELVTKKKKKKKKGEEEKGELHVNIIEANDLLAKDANGFSDPFCKSYLLPDKSKKTKQKTAVMKKNLNPKWNYRFVYGSVTHEELMDKVLELTVWDFDRGSSNDFLGGVRLGLGAGLHEWDDSNSEEQAAWNKMLNNQNDWNQVTLTLRDNMGNHK